MKLFLDTSVLLAACGSAHGASRAISISAPAQSWKLLTSPWVIGEVTRNLPKLPPSASIQWQALRSNLTLVEDVVTPRWIAIFPASKDRPVLLTALAFAQVLLTLDQQDFTRFLGRRFYGLPILTPAEFLVFEREAGRLR